MIYRVTIQVQTISTLRNYQLHVSTYQASETTYCQPYKSRVLFCTHLNLAL